MQPRHQRRVPRVGHCLHNPEANRCGAGRAGRRVRVLRLPSRGVDAAWWGCALLRHRPGWWHDFAERAGSLRPFCWA